MEKFNVYGDCNQLSQCIYCLKVLKHKHTLDRHIKVVHGGLRPYACDCGKRFATKEQLTRHKNSKHTNVKPYVCEMGCEKSFASYTARDYHHRSFHQQEKFQCQVCLNFYSTRNHLKNHFWKQHYQPWATQAYIYFFNNQG